jgi:hypothetical protein
MIQEYLAAVLAILLTAIGAACLQDSAPLGDIVPFEEADSIVGSCYNHGIRSRPVCHADCGGKVHVQTNVPAQQTGNSLTNLKCRATYECVYQGLSKDNCSTGS